MDEDRMLVSLQSAPLPQQYMGMTYEQASRRAVAICAVAAETGQTIAAAMHLNECRRVMEMHNGKKTADAR